MKAIKVKKHVNVSVNLTIKDIQKGIIQVIEQDDKEIMEIFKALHLSFKKKYKKEPLEFGGFTIYTYEKGTGDLIEEYSTKRK